MPDLNLRSIQLGDSSDSSKNFVIKTPAIADGTLVIERGDGTDVLSIAANGKVLFPTANITTIGDQLMGGNLIKMGRSSVTFDATGTATLAFGSAFSTNVTSLILTNSNIVVGGEGVILGAFSVTTMGCYVRAIKASPYGVFVGNLELSWIALGV